MNFDPANMEPRRILAEQLLRSLVTGLDHLAREQGYLHHAVNLQYSIASNHLRVLDNHDAAAAAVPNEAEQT